MMTRNPFCFGISGVQNRSFKSCHVLAIVSRKVLPSLLKMNNVTVIPLILILEYGQSNAT